MKKIKYVVSYSFSLEWYKDNKKGAKVIGEILKIKKEEKGAHFKKYIERDKTTTAYLSSSTGRCDTSIKIGKTALIINKLNHFDKLFYHDIINTINELNIHFVSLVNPENLFKTINVFTTDFENTDPLRIGDLSGFIHYLKKNKIDKYELLINSIRSLLPNIEEINPIAINIREKFKEKRGEIPFLIPEVFYDIRIKEKSNNQSTSIDNISSGSKKLFHILASVILAELSNVPLICLEELENSIHPALLQRLLMILDGMSDNVDILMTSHSPYLIRFLNIDDVLLGIPNEDGVATFSKIKKSKQKKLLNYAQDVGSSLGDLLFDMMLEEQDESSLLMECTEA